MKLVCYACGVVATPFQYKRKKMYVLYVKAKVESPVSQDSWSALRTLSAVQWDSLWSIPNDPFLAPFQKDILWKFLHRVLPTHYRMHRWGLSQSADCLACHSSTPDTIDHVYGDCPIWRDVLQKALSFLHMLHISVNVTTQSDVINLLLSTGSLRVYFLLLPGQNERNYHRLRFLPASSGLLNNISRSVGTVQGYDVLLSVSNGPHLPMYRTVLFFTTCCNLALNRFLCLFLWYCEWTAAIQKKKMYVLYVGKVCTSVRHYSHLKILWDSIQNRRIKEKPLNLSPRQHKGSRFTLSARQLSMVPTFF